MNKEKINLLNLKLYLNYYKKDITDRCIKCIDNLVLDNDVLYTNERLWITTYEKYNKLQAKVNQLETIIDKAIEYVKHRWWLRTDQIYDTSKDLKGWEVEELLSLLERGKE